MTRQCLRTTDANEGITTQSAKSDMSNLKPVNGKPKSVLDAALCLKTIISSLENSKSEDIVSIDLTGKSPLFDHIVVTNGRSNRHVNAITDYLIKDLKEAGFGRSSVEGLPACDWVLIDAGDVVVHVFRPEVRAFYNIEKMWRTEVDQV